MTMEEAIKRLREYAQYSYGIWHNDEEDTKAFELAIEALSADAVQEAVPTVVRVTMSDGNQYYLEHQRDECDHCVYKWRTKGGEE